MRDASIACVCLLWVGTLTAVAAESDLDGRTIVARAHAAAGGDPWLAADTNVLKGTAVLCRGGVAAYCIESERYEMYRVYPRQLSAAHAGSGKFRLDAYRNGRILFTSAFDGQRSYDQNGPLPEDKARAVETNAYGFSAIRFALEPGFEIERLVDDQVEGHPSHFVRVTDPAGGRTIFGIDASDYSIRLAGWQTDQGWHERVYSDFYRVGEADFLQPGRVRFYYDGVKSVDIHWTSAAIGTPIPDETFVVAAREPS